MESPSGLHREWHTLLYLLIMVGIQRRWWPAINAMLCRGVGKVGKVAEDAPVGLPPTLLSMSHSKEEASAKRKGGINTLHYAACVMAATRTQKLASLIVVASGPLRQAQGEDQQRASTVKGSTYYNVDMAAETWRHTLMRCFVCLHDATKLREMGVWLDGAPRFHFEE